jgi:hypothetical protein
VSLGTLRERVRAAGKLPGRLRVGVVSGDVRKMHRLPESGGELFQVASEFNLLEMVLSKVTPGQGVTRYEHDRTQGPACAIAAGAATIYRNYFVPVNGNRGQNAERQLDGLAGLGRTLAAASNRSINTLWEMKNGYALCTRSGLNSIAEHLSSLSCEQLDILRSKLCVGIYRDVEVTWAEGARRPLVSQAFCSASQWPTPTSASPLESVCITGFGSRVRSHDGWRRTERKTRRIERRSAYPAWWGRLRAITTTGFTPRRDDRW